MNISLSPETQKLLERQMAKGPFQNADELVRIALLTFDHSRGPDVEELDEATKAAIERGLAQLERGGGRPWSEAREELKKKYLSE